MQSIANIAMFSSSNSHTYIVMVAIKLLFSHALTSFIPYVDFRTIDKGEINEDLQESQQVHTSKGWNVM